MARINTTHNKVLRILEAKPETRSDDWLLILEVWKDYIDTDIPVDVLFSCHTELGIPNFETIRRCRQKIQANNPHLVNEAMRAIRSEEETEYRQYALDHGCVCCGKRVPEGRQVCPNCEAEV